MLPSLPQFPESALWHCHTFDDNLFSFLMGLALINESF